MITTQKIVDMIEHWLRTPPNAYLGSEYGAPLNELLLNPLSTNVADSFIEKLRKDIPALNQLSGEHFGIYSTTSGFEKRIVVLEVGNVEIELNGIEQDALIRNGETYNVGSI